MANAGLFCCCFGFDGNLLFVVPDRKCEWGGDDDDDDKIYMSTLPTQQDFKLFKELTLNFFGECDPAGALVIKNSSVLFTMINRWFLYYC